VTFMTCQLATRRSSAEAVLVGFVLCGCGSSPTSAAATASPYLGSIDHGKISVGGLAHKYRLFTTHKLDPQNPTWNRTDTAGDAPHRLATRTRRRRS